MIRMIRYLIYNLWYDEIDIMVYFGERELIKL